MVPAGRGPAPAPVPLAGTGLRGMVGSRAVELSPPGRWRALACDVTDPGAVARAIGEATAEVVVHFAAFTAMDEAWRQRGDRGGACYRVNVEGTRAVAEACRRSGRYLVHVSTDYVFDGNRREPYREEDEPDPRDWYGWTKYRAECEVREAGGEFAVLRPSFPFRARHPHRPDVVRKILAGLEAGTLPPMFDDTLITPTFADEFVLAVDRVASLRPAQGLFHCAGATALSPYELARRVAAVFGFPPESVARGRLADHLARRDRPYARYLNVSSEHAERVLGVRFSPIDTALRRLAAQRGAVSVPAGRTDEPGWATDGKP